MDSFDLIFWGVRGSYPCSSPAYRQVGGNTSCVSINAGGVFVIFDAGTGIIELGQEMRASGVKSAVLCLSHGHYDHITGLPFFAPLWDPEFQLTIIAGNLHTQGGVHAFLASSVFSHPFFPVSMEQLKARFTFRDIMDEERLEIGPGIALGTTALNHPGGSTGYRLESMGKSVCYVTDHEHSNPGIQEKLASFVRETNLLIYDASYTDHEYENHIGWGHSTWEEGVRLSRKAGVRHLALYHHDPSHTDDIISGIEEKARRTWPKTFIARQGMRLIVE